MDIRISIDPQLNVESGTDHVSDSSVLTNTRGFRVAGNIGKDFSFLSSFRENQSTFIPYLHSYVNSTRVVPGQGLVKVFKVNAFDYAMAEGHISYSPSSHFNMIFGHGKNFIGDGYRSLLLSDNAFNYPYCTDANFGECPCLRRPWHGFGYTRCTPRRNNGNSLGNWRSLLVSDKAAIKKEKNDRVSEQ